jgi:NAD(P)-dependent dehydrogenase (short-subunit alcohol dehydrogenase family)
VKGGVVVTGASSGIGEACALRLVELGYRVFAGVRREVDGERLAQAAAGQRVQAAPDRLVPLMLDVTDPGAIQAAAERVEELLGAEPLVGLVNNAGIAVGGPLEFIPLGELRRQLEINVVGTVAVAQAFLTLLRRGHGRIVQMGSVSGRFASPFLGPYSASKFALEALSDALRVELRPWGIHVSIIEPGVIATPIWKKSLAAADEAMTEMPPAVEELYGEMLGAVRGEVEGLHGIPAARVADVVAHALTARRPRARYLVVAPSARLRLALTYLPTRLRDWLVARHLAHHHRRHG